MKTRFSALVSIKKDALKKHEMKLAALNAKVEEAQQKYNSALKQLLQLKTDATGIVADFLAQRLLMDKQRAIITFEQENYQHLLAQQAKLQEEFKVLSLEYEKFRSLEAEEIKQKLIEQKHKESKDLDEVALMAYNKLHFKHEVVS